MLATFWDEEPLTATPQPTSAKPYAATKLLSPKCSLRQRQMEEEWMGHAGAPCLQAPHECGRGAQGVLTAGTLTHTQLWRQMLTHKLLCCQLQIS